MFSRSRKLEPPLEIFLVSLQSSSHRGSTVLAFMGTNFFGFKGKKYIQDKSA